MPNEPLQQHHTPPRPPRQATPAQIIILGFLGIILAGALLLMLPVSSQAGVFTPFPNALFTATSATWSPGWSSTTPPPTGPPSATWSFWS